MNFVVSSAFRNSSLPQVRRWATQCSALRRHLRDNYYCTLRAQAIEGDSTDNGATRSYLLAETNHHNLEFSLITCNHGAKFYGSVEHPDRMASLSRVANCAFDNILPTDTIVIYVESDLIWD